MRIDLKYTLPQYMKESCRFDEGLSPDGKTFEVYHRTGYGKSNDVTKLVAHVQSIIKNGFKAGHGDMYGHGFYSTGDLESQFGLRGQRQTMGGYGAAIIKYQVPTKGLFVFDYRLAKKIYGGNAYTLADQYHKIAPGRSIPRVIEVLSDDLEQTFINPKLSADRAFAFWGQFLYNTKGNIKQRDFWLMCDSVPSGILQAYQALTADDFDGCDIYRMQGSIGIAYAGNNDGNVVFIKSEATNLLKPLMYCVMDPSKPGDKKAFIVPWTKVGSAAVTGTTGANCLVDILSAAGVPRSGNSFASVYAGGYPKNGKAAAIDFIKQDFPWTVSPLCHFKKLVVAFCKGKRDYIFDGTWDRGKCTVHFFGAYPQLLTSEKNALKATGFDENSLTSGVLPEVCGGEVECDIFTGGMYGGVFRRGSFQGTFKGGVIDFDGKVDYQTTYFNPTSISSCAIKYGGKIYKIGNTPPDVYLANLKAGASTKNGIASTLADTIKLNLSFNADKVKVADDWRGAANIALGFAAFKKAYPYLFSSINKLKWSELPSIRADNDKIYLDSGKLVDGAAFFDVWSKDTTITSGIVKCRGIQAGGGMTEFNGTFDGGVFEGGAFNGTFNRGTLGIDTLVWGKNAKWLAGDHPRFLSKGRIMNIDPIVFTMMNDAGTGPMYGTFEDVLAGAKSGKIFIDAKRFSHIIKLARLGKVPMPPTYEISVRKNKFDVGVTPAAIEASLKAMDDNREWSMDESVASFDTSEARWVEMGGKMPFSEKEFNYQGLSDEEQAKLYDVFYDTYTKVTGASFTRPDFDWRAAGWIFYGEPPDRNNPNARIGGISVRRQMSNNMYRLTSSFGHPKAVLKGFTEFSARHGKDPAWGIVTPEIAKMLLKRDKTWKTIPGPILKAMEAGVKKISNGEVQSVGINGVMKVSTPAGIMDKLFVANTAYIEWLIDSIDNPANASRLPVPQAIMRPLLHLLAALI